MVGPWLVGSIDTVYVQGWFIGIDLRLSAISSLPLWQKIKGLHENKGKYVHNVNNKMVIIITFVTPLI